MHTSAERPPKIRSTSRLTALVETGLWLVGTGLVISTLTQMYLRDLQARQAVERYLIEQSRSVGAIERHPGEQPGDAVPGGPATLPAGTGAEDLGRLARLAAQADASTDASLWSAARVAAYRAAKSADAALPEAIGVLRLPRLHFEAPVFEGDTDEVLDRGPGWIPGTAALGSSNNIGIAGHRDGHFRTLRNVEVADVIEVISGSGTHRYRVTQTMIVEPDAVHVLDATGHGALTLVTCYPFYFVGHAPQRFIVRAIEESV